MRKNARLVLLASFVLALSASAADFPAPQKVTAEQLSGLLATEAGNSDTEVAQKLSALELGERINAPRSARLSSSLPGDKSRQAFAILVDHAFLLGPPQGDIVNDPQPDAASLRQMLVKVVDYVNNARKRLPNFIATRLTTSFEDRPKEDVQQSTALVSYSYLPLHFVGRTSVDVTFRDGREIEAQTKKKADGVSGAHGLATAGEFGGFLSTVLADAVAGKITWSRWEKGLSGTDAVFNFEVPKDKSHYLVQFCCITENASEAFSTHVYSQKAGYHGQIQFDPASGTIFRITAQSEMIPGELVQEAAMAVEYGPVEIAGKNAILPTRSISILKAHTTVPPMGMHMAVFSGEAKTFLNDVAFQNYHQFRSESRILTESNVGAAPPTAPGTPPQP